MKESYDEGVASHSGPESCACGTPDIRGCDAPRGRGEALTGESTGGLLGSEGIKVGSRMSMRSHATIS